MAADPRQKLNIADTNCALLGSELERKVKEAAAQGEPAWKGKGEAPGLDVWRVEKFQIVPWPQQQYGEFYDGDSYIVLHTTKSASGGDALRWDIYFWLGSYTTQDEAGTAAYKTVELDDVFHGAAVQHREVQGQESTAFLKLFGGKITILNGGIESGFKHVEAGSAGRHKNMPRMYHVAGPTMRTVRVTQLPSLDRKWLAEEDSFIVDDGDRTVYFFQGKACSPGEASNAALHANGMADAKDNGSKCVRVTSDDAPDAFWTALGGKGPVADKVDPSLGLGPQTDVKAIEKVDSMLLQIVGDDPTAECTTSVVAAGDDALKGAKLAEDSCYALIVPKTAKATCWIGGKAPAEKRRAAMGVVHKWLLSDATLGGCGAGFALGKVVQGREASDFTSLVPCAA